MSSFISRMFSPSPSRFVVPSTQGGLGASSGSTPPDSPTTRLAKYVPSEILLLYSTAVAGVVSFSSTSAQVKQWIGASLLVFFLSVTVLWLLKNIPKGDIRKAHLVVSPVAFLALGYPVASTLLGNWYFGLASFLFQIVVCALGLFFEPNETPASPPTSNPAAKT